jgi:hypothetical protein
MSRSSWTPPSLERVTRTCSTPSPCVAIGFEHEGQEVISYAERRQSLYGLLVGI